MGELTLAAWNPSSSFLPVSTSTSNLVGASSLYTPRTGSAYLGTTTLLPPPPAGRVSSGPGAMLVCTFIVSGKSRVVSDQMSTFLRVCLRLPLLVTPSVRPNSLYIPPQHHLSPQHSQPSLIILKNDLSCGVHAMPRRAPAHHDGIHTRENGANGRPFQSAAAGRPKRLLLAVAWDRRAPGGVNARCRSGVLVPMGGDLIRDPLINGWPRVGGRFLGSDI